MTTVTTMLGFTSYNPLKEVIYAAAWLAGPFLIDKLSLKPTSIVSQIDRIRENIFAMRTQFLTFTQTNTLSQYTWAFLKNFPLCMALSTTFILGVYFVRSEMVANPQVFHSCKYALAVIFSLLAFSPEEAEKGNSKKTPPSEESLSVPKTDYSPPPYKRTYPSPPSTKPQRTYSFPFINTAPHISPSATGYKDTSRTNPKGYKSAPTSPVEAPKKHLC